MMKKILAMLLALSVLLCFAACVADNEDEEKTETEAAVQTDPSTEPSEEVTEPTTSAVTTPTLKVNLSKLNYIENNCAFPVTVAEQKVISPYYSLGDDEYDFMAGNDVIKITLQNNTGKTLTKVVFLLLATDENGQRVSITNELTLGGDVSQFNREYPCVRALNLDGLWWANGERESGIVRCAADRFENINIIVYSYTDANGNEVVNEDYEAWLEATIPV